jgi:PIN domain nuclease of toxin-antitoxin system
VILLDTHVLLWLDERNQRLGKTAHDMVAASHDLRVSAMTFWELSMLLNKQQIALSKPLDQMLDEIAHAQETTVVPITAPIAIDANRLPRLHGDPVDRLLIATARDLRCPLMTADRTILDYAAAGHLRAIDARR